MAGKRSAIKTPMIAMTTRSSTSVKARKLPFLRPPPQINIHFLRFHGFFSLKLLVVPEHH